MKDLDKLLIKQSDIDRFWSKVDVRGEDECWEWLGGRGARGGYGQFRLGKNVVSAHRIVFRVIGGYLNNLFVLHSCDNPPCVNPNHLSLGSHAENIQDISNKGRWPSRDNSLTTEKVRLIKALLASQEMKLKDIADLFNVHSSQITKIKQGKIWKNVKIT